MNDNRCVQRSIILMLMLLPIATMSTRAQASEDINQGISAPELSEEFRLLTESEAQLHRASLYDEVKENLNTSRLKKAHQDLIAEAFSKAMSGVPVGSFQRTDVTEQTDIETKEETGKYVVVETGFVEEKETGRQTYFASTPTPFNTAHFLPIDFKRGHVSAQNKTDITFRFRTKTELSMADEHHELLDALVAQKNIRWTMDLTIDKDDRTMKRASFYLERPIRKWFLYRVDTIRTIFDFEFIDDCGCMGVSQVLKFLARQFLLDVSLIVQLKHTPMLSARNQYVTYSRRDTVSRLLKCGIR